MLVNLREELPNRSKTFVCNFLFSVSLSDEGPTLKTLGSGRELCLGYWTQGAMGSRSLETTVGEVLLSNAWIKITVVVPLCLYRMIKDPTTDCDMLLLKNSN